VKRWGRTVVGAQRPREADSRFRKRCREQEAQEGRRPSPRVAPPRGEVTTRDRVGKRAQLAASAVGEGAPVDGWFRVARPGGAREAPRGAARRARDGPAKAAVRRT